MMKLAFSTLGCPNWDLDRIAKAARAYGYEAIELRAIGGELDLPNRPEFNSENIGETRCWLTDQNLAVCCVDTSCTFDSKELTERRHQVSAAIKHGEIAAALGAPLIRVFPDTIQSGMTRPETRDNIAACLHEIALRLPEGVRLGLETHGDFARGDAAAEIVRIADHENVVLIWDVANSLAAGDAIEEAASKVAAHLAHVHLRDARPVEGRDHWLPVLAGRGAVSFGSAVDQLMALDYEGYISFEWEKYWQPEIEEPEVALPDFIQAMKTIFQGVALATGRINAAQST